jgi:hypothetical protein
MQLRRGAVQREQLRSSIADARSNSRSWSAARIASRLPKYWYSVPTLTPATSAMREVVAASEPSCSKIRTAASRITLTVTRERDCRG